MPSVQEIKQLQQIEHEITAAKQQLRALLSNTKKPLSVLAEEQYGKKIEMEPMLTCPIGVTYFTRFLESEMNAENLYCLYEVLSLQDFVAQLQTNTSSALVGEVVKKTHKLLQTYISSGSQQEVNLPAKTKIAIVQVFADAQAKLEQQESNKQTAYLQGILEALHKLKDELLTNLQDPFARYLKSDIFFELASMFMLNRVTVLQARERLMNANKGGEVLNHHGSFDSKTMVPRHPLTVVEDLLNQLIHVFTFRANKLFTSDLQLKYDAYKSSSMCEVNAFKDKVAELAFVDLSLLQSDDEKYAFFTNVHNLMMIHAAMEYEGIPECSYTRVQFLRKVKYTVGGMDLSLDQIAFGILRNNQRHLLFGKRFAATETSKLALIPQSPASLITFGLVDLTSQSPALRIFKPSNFVDQLDQAFVQYLNNRVKFEDSVLYVPSYLKENAKEFAGNNQLQLLTMIQLRMNLEVFSKAIFETNNLATDFTSLFSAEQYKVIRQAVPFVNIAVQKKQSKKNAIKKFVSKISNYAKKALGLQQQQVIAA